jgi:hypothetical protein
MDLIGGYLLVMLVLLSANAALLLGNYEINNSKLIIISLISAVITFALLNASSYLNVALSFLLDYYSYLFLVIAAGIFVIRFYFVKNNEFKISLYLILAMFLISAVLFASQSSLDLLEIILYSLLIFVILFVVYQLSKLLHHAKRQYSEIIGEYMCLASILVFIFAFTYLSTLNLDYSMFSSFLILTPTYQLIYVIISVVVVLVVGVLLNDTKGGIK